MANQKKRSRKSQGRPHGGKFGEKEDGSKKPRLSSNGDNLPSYKEHNTRLINIAEDAQTWYQYLDKTLHDRTSDISKSNNKKSSKAGITATELAACYRKQADEVYRREIQIFSGGNDEKWIDSTIRKGTLKDRIAAMSVIVSQDPVHKFHALDGLLQMAGGSSDSGGQANSRVAQLAAEALEDLFLNTLLPPDRKLQTLEQRPLPALDSGKSVTLSPRILLLWRYEEMLKEKYDSFINNYLSQTLREGLEITKIAALKTAAALLRAVPEGEAKILDLIVNKLGDPQKKTAAAAGHELRAVLNAHPNMQLVIAREVQQLAHRPRLSDRALYNCVAFLNQLKLERQSSGKEANLPAALITTYFKLFEVATRSSAERGINNEVSAKSRLLQALLVGVNRAHPYLPRKDQNMDDHINELYRVVHTAPAGAATQALTLLFHIAVGSPLSKGDGESNSSAPSEESRVRAERYYRALFAALSGTDLLNHGKHSTMFFNVLYKSMKFDNDPKRVVAFAKRLLSTAVHCSAPSFAASIFVLNEVARRHEELRVYLEETPEKESYKTILHPSKRDPRVAFAIHEDGSGAGGNLGRTNTAIAGPPSSWELALASHHYHPSVSKFANNVGSIKYHGDPMQDFSLAPFLDKFAYRNPRAVKDLDKTAGGAAGQRRTLRKDSMDSRLAPPVNDPSFLRRKDTHVHDDFFRKFFLERASRMEILGSTKKKREAVDEDAALDFAESNAYDNFSALEQNWESDSEEEAFVDSLAQNLLVEKAGGAPVDIDSDPDMDDWGDLYDDSDGEGDEGQFVEADDDQFMEADSDSDAS